MKRSSIAVITTSTAAAAVAAMLPLAPPAGAATPLQITFAGGAYGTTASVGTIAKVGKVGASGLCTRYPGQTASNSTAASTLPQIGTVGAVQSQTASSLVGADPRSSSQAQTAATDLLGGRVRFSAVTSSASLTQTGTSYTPAGTASFTGLNIGGNAITASPTKNTVIDLAGIATIRLNVQAATTASGTHSFRVTAMTISLLSGNSLGLPAGSIQIGAATAALHDATFAKAGGSAFGTSVQVGSALTSGKTALVSARCGGTGGSTYTKRVGAVHVSTVVDTGAVSTSARSTTGLTATVSRTTANAAKVNLLNGLVTADAVSAVARFTRNAAGTSSSGSGSSFTNLVVNGTPVSIDPGQNKVIDLKLAKIEINTVTPSANGVTAVGLKITLLDNFGNLAPGAVITLASATATATMG